jgi:hypothetical protein
MSDAKKTSTSPQTKKLLLFIPADVTDEELQVVADILNGALPPETEIRPTRPEHDDIFD